MVGLRVIVPINQPLPLLSQEGNYLSIFIHSGVPNDHGVRALFRAAASADYNRLALIVGAVKRKVSRGVSSFFPVRCDPLVP